MAGTCRARSRVGSHGRVRLRPRDDLRLPTQPWGVPIRQQVVLAGRPVDVLIGERLVVQLDGFAYHSTPADRERDVAHDRELLALGYSILRFTYSEVVYNWPKVERDVARAIAQGQHLAR